MLGDKEIRKVLASLPKFTDEFDKTDLGEHGEYVALKMSLLDGLKDLLNDEKLKRLVSSDINQSVVNYIQRLKPRSPEDQLYLACFIAVFLQAENFTLQNTVKKVLIDIYRQDAFDPANSALYGPFINLKKNAPDHYIQAKKCIASCLINSSNEILQYNQVYSMTFFADQVDQIGHHAQNNALSALKELGDANTADVDALVLKNNSEISDLFLAGGKLLWLLTKRVFQLVLPTDQVIKQTREMFQDWVSSLVLFLERHEYAEAANKMRQYIKVDNGMPDINTVREVSRSFLASVRSYDTDMAQHKQNLPY